MSGGRNLRDSQNASFYEDENDVTRQRVSILDEWFFTDVLTDGDTDYIGYMKYDGTWMIKKYTNISCRIANINNNQSTTDYDNAWSDPAALTYNKVEDL